MTPRSNQRVKRSKAELKRLVDGVIREHCETDGRGLTFLTEEIETHGHPVHTLRVWGALHFFARDEPYCCMEPGCHLWPFEDRLARMETALRRAMRFEHRVALELVSIRSQVHQAAAFREVPA